MELLFNLLWLALSSVLIGLWFVHRDRWADTPLRSSVGMQIVALLLLIVILLPVVSLTDDLHASAMLAESDHMWRRVDLQTVADFAMNVLSAAIIGVTRFKTPPQQRTIARLSLPSNAADPCVGYLRILGIRPPPAV